MRRALALCALLLMVVTACGSMPSSGGPPAAAKPVDAQILGTPLRDPRTGESFTLGDVRAGKVLLIEAMAVWCPVCTDQQRQLRAALPALGDSAVLVSLDIDPNETDAILKRYVEQQGWNWRFAVAPRGLAQGLASTFGTSFLSPPATPLLIIDSRGEGHLSTGVKDSAQIVQLVQRYRPAG